MNNFTTDQVKVLAGNGGFEPPLTDPESAVLPLDEFPIVIQNMAGPAGFEPTIQGPKPCALPLGHGPNLAINKHKYTQIISNRNEI